MDEFEKWLQQHGLDKDSLSTDELQAAETTFAAIQASAELDSEGETWQELQRRLHAQST